MRYLSRIMLFLPLLLGLGLVTGANAQTTSNCDQALGVKFLDVNNVRASIYNNGGLFWRGAAAVYEVPKGGGESAIFASGIWLAGEVNGQLRAAASTYGPWEFWAGPLDESGNPPVDCSIYDRVYKVSKADVLAYEETGSAPPDLREWPTGLGAPTLDANGDEIPFDITVPLAERKDRVIDLAAGERPAILGDMSLWWVMNDLGNIHTRTDAAPIGVEVHGHAFAFNVAGDIGNTTFYKYNLFYKGSVPLTNAYLGIFSDPDLGQFVDDYVGSDTTLGMGYVYNADNDDEGHYGFAPPAAGYDFFQGPIVPSPGDSALQDGEYIQDFKNLKMTSFAFYNNGGGVQGDPESGLDFYNFMKGNWKDGQSFTLGGNGRGFSEVPTSFMFSGDPVTGVGWSEFNPDPFTGSLPAITPADRRFVMATGPFTITPGDQQEIVFGLVWARGSDNLDSVTKLRQADALAQAAFDVNFVLPEPPAAPIVSVTESNGQILLEWTNSPRSNNYLESYTQYDPFGSVNDPNYDFEGYRVIQYADPSDQVGRVIATYDVPNGVKRVIDGREGEPSFIAADGNDTGVQNFHKLTNLTNYKTYYLGVQAFAYNEPSNPKIFQSPVTRVEVIPTKSEDVLSEAAVSAAESSAEPDLLADRAGVGEGRVWVDVVNPARITGDTYTVEFYEVEDAGRALQDAEVPTSTVKSVDDELIGHNGPLASKSSDVEEAYLTYDIKKGGTVVFDGKATGSSAPLREKLIVIDGLQWSIVGPAADIKGFAAVANAAGAINPPDMAAFAFNSSGFPILEDNGVTPPGTYPAPDRPTGGVQQTNGSTWGIHTGPSDAGVSYGNPAGGFNVSDNGWVGRSIREGWGTIGSDDYEWRFTQDCFDGIDGVFVETDCLSFRGFEDGEIVEVPFTFWNVGLDVDDPSDDFQMIPVICEAGCGHPGTEFLFDIAGDHEISGGDNDPYTDWVYFYKPEDNGATPGSQGYLDFFFGEAGLGDRTFSRQVIVNWNGGTDPGPYDADLPEAGTVFRYITYNPIAAGDVFTVNTNGLEPRARNQSELADALGSIGITPNPYKGASDYERSQLIPEVRFTNLPEQATIRVFTISGTLVKTFEKSGPEHTLTWDLTTDNSLPIASGVYLIHVETSFGTKVIKFAAIQKRTALNTF